MIDHVRANNKACIVKRKGGGLPDREFDSVRDAADWCRETGREYGRHDQHHHVARCPIEKRGVERIWTA